MADPILFEFMSSVGFIFSWEQDLPYFAFVGSGRASKGQAIMRKWHPERILEDSAGSSQMIEEIPKYTIEDTQGHMKTL